MLVCIEIVFESSCQGNRSFSYRQTDIDQSFNLLPFDTGRKYAMLKLKILLSTIMRNYRVYSDLSESDFRLQADIILKREEGFRVRLQPRQPGQATTTGSTAAS